MIPSSFAAFVLLPPALQRGEDEVAREGIELEPLHEEVRSRPRARGEQEMKIGRMVVAAGALASAACGAGMDGTSSDVAAMQAYQALAKDVTAAVGTYQAETATLPDDPTCQAAHGAYAAQWQGCSIRW